MVAKGREFDCDIAVVGSGPAGYVAAIRAAQLGADSVVIEKGPAGGVCTNTGCIPTKALLHTARLRLMLERASDTGLDVSGAEFDFSKTAAHRDAVVEKLRGGVESLLQANKVRMVRGQASFADPHTLKVKSAEGGNHSTLSASRIIIASGSRPTPLPGVEFDGDLVIDSSGAVGLNELPGSILIVGGGYIGCEFAAAFAAMGVEVSVVEMLDRLLPLMDGDCSKEATRRLKKMGVDVGTGVKLEELQPVSGGIEARLSGDKTIKAEKALISVGRKPSTEGLALEAAGVELAGDGAIAVNEHMQTGREHIYAIGDVTGGIMLAHCGSHEGTVAAEHATGTLSAAMDYRVVPACVFTIPEVATVGVTEEKAEEDGLEVEVKKFPLRFLGKALIDGAGEGFVKMIAEARTGELLGVHIVAADASSLIGEAALALKLETTAAELADCIHAHPTMPESLMETAQGLTGRPVNWLG